MSFLGVLQLPNEMQYNFPLERNFIIIQAHNVMSQLFIMFYIVPTVQHKILKVENLVKSSSLKYWWGKHWPMPTTSSIYF